MVAGPLEGEGAKRHGEQRTANSDEVGKDENF